MPQDVPWNPHENARSDAIYSELPAWAGIEDPQRAGWSVDEAVGRLARIAAVLHQLSYIASARLSSEPVYELKAAYARLAHEDILHYAALEHRLDELRNQSRLVARVLDYQLGDFLREALFSDGTVELATAFFTVLKPELLRAVNTYLAGTNALADYESVRILKHLRLDLEEHLRYGQEVMRVLTRDAMAAERCASWERHLQLYLAAAEGILGDQPRPDDLRLPPPTAREEYRIPREFARDGRFQQMIPKIHPEPPAPTPPVERDLLQMMWARNQEMTAAELCFSVACEWEEMDTDFLRDLTRHGWDEARHSLFGRAVLETLGVAIWNLPAWVGYAGHTMPYPPPKRYAHLAIATEARAMRHPGGKRGQWEFCRDVAQHELATTLQDFDWADEVNHVHFGRRWLVRHHFQGDNQKAWALADETMRDREVFYAGYAAQPARPDEQDE